MSAGRKRSHTGSAVPTAGAVPTSVLFSRPAMGPSSASPPASEGTRTGRAISTSSAVRWAPSAGGSASLSKAPIEPADVTASWMLVRTPKSHELAVTVTSRALFSFVHRSAVPGQSADGRGHGGGAAADHPGAAARRPGERTCGQMATRCGRPGRRLRRARAARCPTHTPAAAAARALTHIRRRCRRAREDALEAVGHARRRRGRGGRRRARAGGGERRAQDRGVRVWVSAVGQLLHGPHRVRRYRLTAAGCAAPCVVRALLPA